MKLTIQEIKKEAFKLLSNCFGVSIEQPAGKREGRNGNFLTQTPDYYNNRSNSNHRKNLVTTNYPN